MCIKIQQCSYRTQACPPPDFQLPPAKTTIPRNLCRTPPPSLSWPPATYQKVRFALSPFVTNGQYSSRYSRYTPSHILTFPGVGSQIYLPSFLDDRAFSNKAFFRVQTASRRDLCLLGVTCKQSSIQRASICKSSHIFHAIFPCHFSHTPAMDGSLCWVPDACHDELCSSFTPLLRQWFFIFTGYSLCSAVVFWVQGQAGRRT